MTTRDVLGLVVSYVYAFGLLALAEVIRRWRGYPQDFTRKLVHIGAGMWVFGVLALFETWYIGIVPFATFIAFNFIAYRYRLLGAVDDEESTPGTVYFAVSITLLFLAFWRTDSPQDRSFIAAAGAMAMTWGDSMAAIIGRRWGRHYYTAFGSRRTLEGSAAMFVASGLAMLLTILFVPGSPLSPLSTPPAPSAAIVAALAAAAVAALSEALSPHGTDNISVPLLAGLTINGVLTLVAG